MFEKIPGEGLLTKIWETIAERGIGGLATPWQIRREGRARTDVRRDELLKLAQAETDAADIRAGRKRLDERGRLALTTAHERKEPRLLPYPDAPHAQTEDQSICESVRKEIGARSIEMAVNLRRTVLEAETQAESTPDADVADEKVKPDWFERWKSHAQEVSDDQLQKMWAAVLAGEVKRPGTFGLRTMNFLHELSREEAELISLVATFAIDGKVVFREGDYLASLGLPFVKLLALQELGIISGVEAVGGLTWEIKNVQNASRFQASIVSHARCLTIDKDDPTTSIKLPVYALTQMAQEIMQLGLFQADESYLQHVAAHITKNGFKVTFGKVVSIVGQRYCHPD